MKLLQQPEKCCDRRCFLGRPTFVFILYFLLDVAFCDSPVSKNTLMDELEANKFPPCKACKILATSFQKRSDYPKLIAMTYSPVINSHVGSIIEGGLNLSRAKVMPHIWVLQQHGQPLAGRQQVGMREAPRQSSDGTTPDVQMDKTARGRFEGGDSAWEEEKQGMYAHSEVRLVEIQENICSDVKEGKHQCLFLAEENEHVLEDWFFHKLLDKPNVLNFLCIDTLKVCCPSETYGSECKPCPGYPENVCNKCGKCQGAGTRKGSGKCICDNGYTGSLCNLCAENHFEVYRDLRKLLCSPCHASCSEACTQAGTTGCISCKPGWHMDTDRGCVDFNECLAETSVCNKNQFCVNNEGSYSCIECDKSCASCQGDGPDMCEKCSKGYTPIDKFCVDEQKQSRDTHVNLTRYLTYFGLCIATFIIFQKNPLVASAIGLCVALYISVSEYMVRTTSTDNSLLGLNVNNIQRT